MNVDGPQSWNRQYLLRQDMTISCDHKYIGVKVGHHIAEILSPNRLGLDDRAPHIQRSLFYRGKNNRLSTSLGPIRLGNYLQNPVSTAIKVFKRRNRELRRAHKHNAIRRSHDCFNLFLMRFL